MEVVSWNCGGAFTNLTTRQLSRWAGPGTVVALQETMVLDSARFPPTAGFHQELLNATASSTGGRPSGGLAVLVAFSLLTNFDVTRVPTDGFPCEVLAISLTPKTPAVSDSFVLVNVYVPAPPKPPNFSELGAALVGLLDSHVDSDFVICGDFNAHRLRDDNTRDLCFNFFVAALESNGFTVFPPLSDIRPTFVGPQFTSSIDFFFVRGIGVNNFEVLPRVELGHREISLSIDLPCPPSPIVSLPPTRRFLTGKPLTFFRSLRKDYGFRGPREIAAGGIEVFSRLYFLFLASCTFSTPLTPPEEPWQRYLTHSEQAFLRARRTHVLALSASLSPSSLSGFHAERRNLRSLEIDLHSRSVTRLQAAVKDSFGSHTSVWAFVRRFRIQSGRSGGLPVEMLLDHFAGVYNRRGDPLPVLFESDFAVSEDPDLDRRFSMEELRRAVSSANRASAPGENGYGMDIILGIMKSSKGPRVLLDFMNACFSEGKLPKAWAHAELFLLFKGKGDPLDPNSYRGICLLDTFYKLFERLIYHRLSVWAEAKGLLPDCQFGFRAQASTTDAAFVFQTLFRKYTRGGQHFHAVLIDLRKAFPSVHRQKLLSKLAGIGVSKKVCQALFSCFHLNTFAIKTQSGSSRRIPVTTGLREGSVLSPLLFSLYISDLPSHVLCPLPNSSFLHSDPSLLGITVNGILFADDLVIFGLTRQALNARLSLLSSYCTGNSLTVNVGKCEVITFGTRARQLPTIYQGQQIPESSSCRYLGFWFSWDGSDSAAWANLLSSFGSASSAFSSLLRKMHICEPRKISFLAQSLLFSIPMYHAPFLTNFSKITKLEKRFFRSVRSALGFSNGVSDNMIRALFPDLDLCRTITKAKFLFLHRHLRHTSTIFPLATVYDRCFLFPAKLGFSFDLSVSLRELGLPDLIYETDLKDASRELSFCFFSQRLVVWNEMSQMSSTSFLCETLCDLENFDAFVLEASKLGPALFRLVFQIWTGTFLLSLPEPRRSCPFCPLITFTACHAFFCPRLFPIDAECFFSAGYDGDVSELILFTLNRYIELRALIFVSPFSELDEEVLEFLS